MSREQLSSVSSSFWNSQYHHNPKLTRKLRGPPMKWSATWDEAVTLSAASKRPLLIDAFSPQ